MLKIAHIVPSFYPALYYGGPTQSVYQLCRHLPAAGCEVRVLSTNANGPGVVDVDLTRETKIIDGLSVRFTARWIPEAIAPGLLTRLASYIRWADVVHLMAVYSFPTIPTLAMARAFGKPVVWSPRGSLQRWPGTAKQGMKEAWESVCRVAARKDTVLHVTSVDEAGASSARMNGMRAVVIPNGVEIPERSKTKPRNGTLQMLYLGRLHPIKGIENLLEGCHRFDGGASWALTIAGAGEPSYVDTLKARIGELGLMDKVRMTGHVSGEAKETLLLAADMLMVPSHTENFGLVVTESLAHGVPVVASQGTPWKELPEVGCGMWVRNDPDSLAGAMREMEGQELGEMGKRGRQWVEREFQWSQVARKMTDVYRELAG